MDPTPKPRRARRLLSVGASVFGLTLGTAGVAVAVTGHGSDHRTEADDGADPVDDVSQEQRFTDAHRSEVAVSQEAAEAAARVAKPGRLFDSHLQEEDGQMVWEVKSDDGTTVWEIQIDPTTAAVVHLQVDD